MLEPGPSFRAVSRYSKINPDIPLGQVLGQARPTLIMNFRQQLQSGKHLLGTMVTLPTAATAEILADLGFD